MGNGRSMLDLNLLKNIMSEIRENDDLLDSLSPNQFATKLKLVEHVDKLDFLNKDSKIVIIGSWYGSILIPAFYHKVKQIVLNNLVKKEGCLIIEHDKNTLFDDQNAELRKYGTVHFSIFSF